MSTATADLLIGTIQDHANFQANTVPLIRAYGGGIRAALIAAGAVAASDTGQIADWAALAVTTPTVTTAGANVLGYEMYRFNDAHQGAAPVFIKVTYYFQPSAVTGTGLYYGFYASYQFGTATNGAGTLTGTTGQVVAFGAHASGASTTSTNYDLTGTSRRHWFSIGDSWFNVVAAPLVGNQRFGVGVFSLERTRDTSGTATATGVQWLGFGTNVHFQSATSVTFSTTGCYSYASSTLYQDSMASSATTRVSPFAASPWGTAYAAGADIAVLPAHCYIPLPQGQPLNWLGYGAGDLAPHVTIPVTVSGVSHTYLPIGVLLCYVAGTAANVLPMVRYE